MGGQGNEVSMYKGLIFCRRAPWKKKWQDLPCQLPIGFTYKNLSRKVTNGEHMTVGCYNHFKYKPMAKLPNPNHVTTEYFNSWNFKDQYCIKYRTFSTVVTI